MLLITDITFLTQNVSATTNLNSLWLSGAIDVGQYWLR